MQQFSRLSFLLLFLLCISNAYTQDSLNVSLVYHWEDTTLVPAAPFNNTYNEIWGLNIGNREYAVLGSTAGTHIFDITDPLNVDPPVFIPGASQGTKIIHRDFHDHNGYLYIVSDENQGNGIFSTLQIADLSFLPASAPLVYDSNTLFSRSHNIFIDEASGRLYTCGGDNNNGLRVFSLANPELPVELVNFTTPGGVHDVFVRNDTAYVNMGNLGLFIYDMSTITSPTLIGSLTSYPDQGYNHSGWLTENGNVYAFADETLGMDVKICDVSNLANINVLSQINSSVDSNSIAHNLIINGDYLYLSYYYDGLQIFDISDPANPFRTGYYDTYSLPNMASYKGAWGVYPFLASGLVLISDMQSGLYVLDVSESICNNPVSNFSFITSNLTANFIDASTFKGNPAYSWDYGDGSSISTLQNPSHTYTLAGTYNVCLTIVDSCGSDLICQSVTVIDSLGCPPPSSYFTYAANGLSIIFTDSSIVSGNATYSWDFGDGSGAGTQQNTSYTYAASGTYNVCLTVTDSCGIATICNAVTITLGTGMHSTDIELDWWVGPNPFSQDFSVFLPLKDDELIEYSIYDISGKRVGCGVGLSQNGKLEISDVGELLPGIYLLELKTNNLYLHEKIAKFLPLR